MGKWKSPAERNRCICFLCPVGRRRNGDFVFQCERLCFRFDIQNASVAKAKVKPGSKFLGKMVGLLEVFNKILDGYQA